MNNGLCWTDDSLVTAFQKQGPNPSGGIDNLLVRRAIIKVVWYRMIASYIHAFTEPRRRLEEEQTMFRIVSGRIITRGYYDVTTNSKFKSDDLCRWFAFPDMIKKNKKV